MRIPFFLFFIALPFMAHAAERIPGSQVTLQPPAEFELSAEFTGYHKAATNTSIMVTEIPGPFAEVREGMTRENLENQGARVISLEKIKLGTVDGLLIEAEREAEDGTYRQWLLVFGDATSVVINAIAPKEEFAKLSAELKKCLLATKWEPGLEVPIHEGLPYTVGEAGDLKFAFKMQKGVIMSRGGIHPIENPALPMVMVNAIADPAFTADLDAKTYAFALLDSLGKIPQQRTILGEKGIAIDGLKGYQVEVSARPEDADTDIYYRLSLALTDGWIYLQFCRIAEDEAKTYKPTFDKILESIDIPKP